MKSLTCPLRLTSGTAGILSVVLFWTIPSVGAVENSRHNVQVRFGGSGVSVNSTLRLHSRIGSFPGRDALMVAARVAALEPAIGSTMNTNAVSPETQGNLPLRYALYPSRPNPFNPTTQIAFDLPLSGHVELVVFDVHGRRVQTLVDRLMTAGQHQVVWSPETQASGVYVYRIRSGEFTQTRRTVLLK